MPDARITASDCPAGRRCHRAQASAFVSLLRHALAIEGEKYLCINHCQSRRAFFKTYDGKGNEPFFLAG